MAGPTASVLLPSPLSAEDLVMVNASLSARGWLGEGEGDRPEPASVACGYPMDWQYRVRGQDGCEIDYEELESLDVFEAAIGWTPTAEISLLAAVNEHETHLELAIAAVDIVRSVGGVIDLGGTVDAPTDLPGRCWPIPYGFDHEHQLEFWVVDVAWLEAWMRHPGFRMVK